MSQLFTNNAISLLTTPLAANDLTFSVINGDESVFPQPIQVDDFFLVTFEDPHTHVVEIVKVTGRTGNVFQIDSNGRGFEDTPIRAWPVDTLVDHRLTAYTLKKTNAILPGDSSTPIVVPSADVRPVNYLVTSTLIRTCKWLITVIDVTGNRASLCEVMAVYRGASIPPAYTVYGKVGDNLRYTVSVVQSGNEMICTVNNNDTVPLTTSIVRISAI
ncbi:MAG: hypothetical protein QXN55_01450 [Candidatus Nitrosotenuis sp.]